MALTTKDILTIRDLFIELFGKRLDKLEQGQDDMRKDISSLKDDVSVLKVNIIENRKDIQQLKEESSETREDLIEMKDDVSGIRRELDTEHEVR